MNQYLRLVLIVSVCLWSNTHCLEPCIDFNLMKMYKQYGLFKDYLYEFQRSACSPVILVPGVMGSRLRVKIDCEVLKKEHSDKFEECGWNSCKKGTIHRMLGKKAPADEYNLWVSDLTSPISIFNINGKSAHCWNTMIS